MEYHRSGGVFQHQVHIVGNQDNRDTLTVQLPQKIHNFRVMLQILTGGRLVQQNHLRLQNQNGSNRHALLLPIAQGGNGPVSEGVQSADFQRFLHSGTDFLLRHLPVSKAQRHFVINLRLGNHLIGILHHITNVVSPLLDGQGVQVDAVQFQNTALGFLKTADYLGEGGLSGAVGADNAEHLPLVDRHTDTPQGMVPAVIGKI